MSMFSRPGTFSPASLMRWMLNLATRMLARSLQLPEPLVHSTGVFVFARVQAVETRAVKTLCPVRLLGRLQAVLQNWRRTAR